MTRYKGSMSSQSQSLIRWPRFPPIVVPDPPSAQATAQDEPELVVVCVGRFLGWLLGLFPGWEEISREEAAKFILAREIRVKYTPIIIELDRKPNEVETRF